MVFSLSAESQGHFLKGIIYKLVNILKISDPIASRYVIPTASSTNYGNVETLVLWNSDLFQTSFTLDKPWIQLEFSNRYIFPNAYSMRGVNDNRCFAKQWKVYGIYEGDISTSDKWITLGLNDTSEAPYCNVVDSNNGCNDLNVGTFTMKPVSLLKGFRYLRWVFESSQSSCGSQHFFAASALDVYGTLSDKSSAARRKGMSYRCYNKASLLCIILFNAIAIK